MIDTTCYISVETINVKNPPVPKTPLPEEEPPTELSMEYLEVNPGTYSNLIVNNLKTNKFFLYLFQRKQRDPTPQEMLLVASVVVAASDQKIASLEQEKIELKKEASNIRAFFGTQIFKPAELPASTSTTEGPSGTPAALGAEQAWIAKYLTLGNVMGVIVVALGLIGGFVTYFTSNFKDKAHRAEEQVTFWQTSSDKFETAAKTANTALDKAQSDAKNQHEGDQRTINDLNARLSQSQGLSKDLSEQLKQAQKKSDDLQKQVDAQKAGH